MLRPGTFAKIGRSGGVKTPWLPQTLPWNQVHYFEYSFAKHNLFRLSGETSLQVEMRAILKNSNQRISRRRIGLQSMDMTFNFGMVIRVPETVV